MSVKNKNIEDFYPLSPMQQGILFHSLAAKSGIYFEQFSLTIQGKLNIPEFRRAWQYVVERHSILRTCFVWEGLKEPVQIVHRQVSLPWQEYNWQHLSLEEQQQKLELFWQSDRSRGLELTQPPLMRFTLVQLSDNSYNFTWSHHHLLLDGWSVPLVFKEVFACYKAFNNGQDVDLEPIRPYRDYIVWLQQQNLFEAETFWRQLLKGFTAPTQLLVNQGARKLLTQTDDSKEREVKLSVVTTARLQSLAKQHQLTLNTLVQGAWALLLSRYSGQEDVVFGAVTSGRPPTLAKVESMVGLLINTLPIRAQVSPEEFILPWLGKIRDQLVEARQYEYTPLVKVQGWSEVPKDLSLFESIVVFENYPIDASLLEQNLNLKIKDFHAFERTNYPITLTVIPGENLLLKITCSDRFDTNTITRMLGHLQTLLENMLTKTQQRLGELSLLTEAERHQLLVEWNDTEVKYPQQCIHELFEAQVEKTPDAVAVVFADQELTYSQLNTKANQLGHYLQSIGVKPEVLVGICLERSLEMVIGLLAILKAGGAYIPLDPAYPQQRLAFILEDTQASVLLTQTSLLQAIPQHQAEVVCLDADWHYIAQQSQEHLFSQSTPDNLAYVIYTSGSTGRPKGVMIKHASTVAMLDWANKTFEMKAKKGVLASTSICFDLSVFEIFVPLCCGGKVLLIENALHLPTLATAESITLINTVPSVISQLLKTDGIPTSVQTVNIAGEPLHNQLVQQLYQQENIQQVFNLYGPSEDTTYSTSALIQKGNSDIPPIGRPIHNTQIYLLDQNYQPVPVGVPGMLYIGGAGLARGYLNQPELTADKFIPNPFQRGKGEEDQSSNSARLYKTGDLARYLPNGEIEYIGRIDYQVKVRGFRIELGEIEALINQHPAVQETVVIVGEDFGNSQRLVAYVVPQAQTLTIAELRGFLESKLPSYMIPGAFVILEALPLTPNGKVNRKALPIPDTQTSSNIIPPSTPIENLLAGIWAEVLGIEKVSINNSFFELGGHSLIATRVISRIRQVFKVELALRYLFEKSTIAGLAKEIEKAIKVDSKDEPRNIERISRSQELPLSFAQQRLWFLDQLEPNNPFYNIAAAVRLEGQLNIGALEQSFNEIISRHEALRTNFQTIEGQAIAIISEAISLILPTFDISELPLNLQEAEVKKQASQEAQKPFDLKSDLLLRVKLLRLNQQEHIILLTMHHIVSDGWSIDILVRELATLYQAFCNEQPSGASATHSLHLQRSIPLPALPIQYVDFAAWQREWLQGKVLKTQISYWLKQLKNAPKVLELPTDYPRPAIQTFRGSTYSFKLSNKLSFSLNKLSQQQGSTLFMTLLAAFQTLLWRYTGSEDIVIGSPIANRNRAEIEGLIGFFVNTLVLRTNLAGNPSFEELLKRVREVALGAYAHQDLPFELLVEELRPQRDLSHTPLFQVMFVLQNAPMSALELPGLTFSPLESNSDSAKLDLTLYITETVEGLLGNLEYNTDLFEESSIQRMAAHLQTLLERIVVNSKQRLSELPLLTKSEQYQLIVEWNDTEVKYPQQCIHELFEAQVEKTPDAVAVVFADQELTYSQLNTKANQLGHYLQALGVKPEVLVGICLERSLEMVIGLLAILKAGGAYIPLDPAYPQQRLAFILEDTQASVLLTQTSLLQAIPQHQAEVVCLDADWHYIAQQSQEHLFSQSTPDNLAYVIYTSGSTGRPKGVQIPHSALSNFLYSMRETPGLTQEDTLLAVTTYSFDIAALELFLPIIVGGRLVIASRKVASDGTQLSVLLTDSKATVMQATPATWQLLITAGWSGNQQLKILCGGEALSGHLANQLLARCACLWNMYGPTETTIWSAASQVEIDSTIVAISRAIANTQLYILDQYSQLVPVGVAGELHIGGDGLARGYFNRPDLTAEKFIPNPFSKKAARLYKTGDLARYLPNGEIEYIGRIDHQVKLRGFRIELGEIEAVISQYQGVREAVVVVRNDSLDSKCLVAYVIPQIEQTLIISELRSFLESKLPNYMLPGAFVILEALPLTPNGKVDRKALPALDSVRPEFEDFVAPQTLVEKQLAIIWMQILGLEKIGINDNFFELGGHSLLATQVISRINQIFDIELPLRQIFELSTIAKIAKSIEEKKITTKLAPPIERVSREIELPLSFAQQRLWFLHQLDPKSYIYNGSSAVLLQGSLNVTALEQSINEIVRRHEILRTCFHLVNGQPVQLIAPVAIQLPIVDLQHLPDTEQTTDVKKLRLASYQQPFDLAQAPLLRLTLVRLKTREYILLVTMHHIIFDAWSEGVFIQELSILYEAFSNNNSSPLPEMNIQYADFATWQYKWLQGEVLDTLLKYWKKQLGDNLPVLQLPKIHQLSEVKTSQEKRQNLILSKTLSQAIKKLSDSLGTTLFMTLLGAFKFLLYWYTGDKDIVVGTDIANRNRIEIENLIGFFVNQLVLRSHLSENFTFSEFLQQIRQVCLEAYAHQDLPFEKLVSALNPKRELNQTPLFQVKFILQNAPMHPLELANLTLTRLDDLENTAARFDLLLELTDTEQGIVGLLKYNKDLFDASSIARLLNIFEIILSQIVVNPAIKLNQLEEIIVQSDREYQLSEERKRKKEYQQKLSLIKRKAIEIVTEVNE
ncbi:MAG: amino acid adenylation domain-containing protein [Komarekiella atlantica HA4396-MV6]|nr:amino acid adenylation domain-containing protein [Komarekiella atlantica HA4396-MV6]